MDVKSLFANQRYEATKQVTQPQQATEDTAQNSVSESFAESYEKFANTLQESEQIAKAAMAGDADPHALVQALAQTELAVETAVTIRNKVVEAYQEILRMPV